MLVENALKKIIMVNTGKCEVWWNGVGLELTGFSVHFIRRELERRNTEEYKSYK